MSNQVVTGPSGTAGKQPQIPFWIGLVLGWGVMLYGLMGLLEHQRQTHPVVAAKWFVGAALVHDLVLAPVVFALGWVITRFVSSSVRPFVQGALFVSSVIALYSFPSVRGYGRLSNNPSILPNNYAHGLVLTLAFVWAGAAVLATARLQHRRAPEDDRA